ncbi:hypothetical protein ACWGMA_20750 [Streptomyces asiaticus]
MSVTYRKIAAAAGVPLGSLTYYFDDAAPAHRGIHRLAEAVSTSPAAKPGLATGTRCSPTSSTPSPPATPN